MQTSIKKLPKSEIELEIKVPSEEFDGFMEKAVFNLGKELEVEGFRKGKAPKEIIEKAVGQEKILKEAAQLTIKENYIKAVDQLIKDGDEIEPLGQPEIEILKMAPGNVFEFKAKTSVLSKVVLPDYKKIASQIKKKEIVVSEEEAENSLKWLQKSRAKLIAKPGPCKQGDWVEIEFSSSQIENGAKKTDKFVLGEAGFAPGFEKNLGGMENGQEKEFTLNINKEKDGPTGGKANFKVKMNAVCDMNIPEANDEFASSLGQFKDLDSLKKNIKEGLEQEKQGQESQRIRQEIIKGIAHKTEIEISEVLIGQEKERLMENLRKTVSQDLRISFQDYLAKVKKTEDELMQTFLPQARERVKNFLILRELAKAEEIEATDDEIEEEVNKV